jgi:hypothetical protein
VSAWNGCDAGYGDKTLSYDFDAQTRKDPSPRSTVSPYDKADDDADGSHDRGYIPGDGER